MATYAEQIAAFEQKRAANEGRMKSLMDVSAEKGETLDADQQDEFDNLLSENESIDDHLTRLKKMETINLAQATPVHGKTQDDAARTRAAYGSVTVVKRPTEKGIVFTRLLGAKYLGKQNNCHPADIAKRWNDTPEVEMILRATITPGSTTDSTFAEPLVQLNNATGEFIELLRAKEIIGRIPGLDRVPFNIKVPRGTGDPAANWVGEGRVKPVSRMTFDSLTMTFAKVAGIVPMTEELLKFSNPSAELKVRDGLVGAITYLTDRDFLDPTKAEQVGVSPASITYNVTPIEATGTDADAFRADFATALEEFAEANQDDLSGLVVVMTTMQAIRLSLMRNALGQREFPDIAHNGGTIEGFPVVTSSNIAASGGSPTDGYPIVLVNAPDVFISEEGVEVDLSREASLQMEETPDSPATASTTLISLWQHNMVAIKAERFINWKKKRSTSVQFIAHAKYR